MRADEAEVERIQKECSHPKITITGGRYEFTAVTAYCAACDKLLVGIQGEDAKVMVVEQVREQFPDAEVVYEDLDA
jgi:hypothetical protein